MLILSFAIVLLDKDVLQKEPPTWVPPSYLSIREVDVKPVEITSAMIEVNVTAYITIKGQDPEWYDAYQGNKQRHKAS